MQRRSILQFIMLNMFTIVLTMLASTLVSADEVNAFAIPPAHQRRVDLEDLWVRFKNTYNKQYNNEGEELYRRSVWEENIEFIQKHNIEADLGLHTFTVGVNEYADLSFHEYQKFLLGERIPFQTNHTKQQLAYEYPESSLPRAVDWRSNGAVTPVQNQGICGSCWAFSATGALEGQWYLKNKKLVKLSEQNLVDCSKAFGNFGCAAGSKANAFRYIIENRGIDTAESYPYESKDSVCRFNPSNVGATCTGYKQTQSINERSLREAVALIGPIAVSIDADHESLKFYKSGIYNEPKCTATTTHSVLVVGYGSEGDDDYWIVKNSWGTSWGEDGYVRMSRNRNNQCGIALFAFYPIV